MTSFLQMYKLTNTELNFLQLNFGRRKAAHDFSEQLIKEDKIDFVIGQEPNIKTVINYYCDTNCDSFIGIRNKDVHVLRVQKSPGFICVELKQIVIVSCYFTPNKNIEEFKTLLNNLEICIKTTTKI